MNSKYFSKIILISALFIAICAGYFSITGINGVFAGAPTASIFFAVSLEIGKLVSVTFLYRYWKKINKILRGYLLVGSIILSAVTSFGIYTFLSAAYTTSTITLNDSKLNSDVIDNQSKENLKQIEFNKNRISNVEKNISLQENRLDNLINKDKNTSQQQSVIRQNTIEISNLQKENSKLLQKNDSLSLEKNKIIAKINNDPKLGTFWYFSKTIGIELDVVIRWFVLIIVLVFDPLALSLMIAYNISISKSKEDENIDRPESTINTVDIIDEDSTLLKIQNNEIIKNKETEEVVIDTPYYMKDDYDWEHDHSWKDDFNAKHYKQTLEKSIIDYLKKDVDK